MFYYLLVTLYVLVCLVLMIVILLQQGKGGDIANAFGGGSSQAAFGARGGATVLTKVDGGPGRGLHEPGAAAGHLGLARHRVGRGWRGRSAAREPARRRHRHPGPADHADAGARDGRAGAPKPPRRRRRWPRAGDTPPSPRRSSSAAVTTCDRDGAACDGLLESEVRAVSGNAHRARPSNAEVAELADAPA